jgi:hypothetical protein
MPARVPFDVASPKPKQRVDCHAGAQHHRTDKHASDNELPRRQAIHCCVLSSLPQNRCDSFDEVIAKPFWTPNGAGLL